MAATSPRLTVATFNIWFDAHHIEARHNAILGLMEERRPDVIALQEVTLPALNLVLSKPWIQAEYQSTDLDGRTLGRYGVVLLSRIPMQRVTLTPLPSRMDRGLLVADLDIGGVPISVATVHLESLKEAATRGIQLQQIFDQLADRDNAVLMGDFNFCSSWQEENVRIRPDYVDVWPAVHPDNPGFTEDTTINRMRYLLKGKHKHVRFDRILLKSAMFQPSAIELLGTQPISPEFPEVYPSDHFGLFATIG